jgi:predicted DCC family thiol-disulfide oxidoreductase YuxK
MSPEKAYRIIAFDGLCNLCNSTVNWVIDNDAQQQFKFIALQHIDRLQGLGIDLKEFPSIQNLASADLVENDHLHAWQSVYLIQEGQLYEKSTAVLKICQQLSGLYPLLYLYIIIPRPLRDLVYDVIAKNRYKWFGKRKACRIPTPELKNRFL